MHKQYTLTFSSLEMKLLREAIKSAESWKGEHIGNPDQTTYKRVERRAMKANQCLDRATEVQRSLSQLSGAQMTTNMSIAERRYRVKSLSPQEAFDAGVRACAKACLDAGGRPAEETSSSSLNLIETQRIIGTLVSLS